MSTPCCREGRGSIAPEKYVKVDGINSVGYFLVDTVKSATFAMDSSRSSITMSGFHRFYIHV